MDKLEGYRLAVVGSRDFEDFDLFVKIMDRLRLVKRIDAIISGGAKGVDSMAKHYAEVNSIEMIEHLPNWKKYGKSAAFIRNKDIIDDSTMCLAIWDGESKGTLNSITISNKQNKPTLVFNYKENRWMEISNLKQEK